jgi:WD40 repeat protein
MSGLMRRTPIEDALRERWVLRLPDCVVACQVSVDSDTVYAATASGQICALSLENGTQRYQIVAHQIGCNDLALSEAGDVLASAGQDGRLCFWDAATGQPIQEYSTAPAWVERVVAARDWNAFFVGAGKRVLAFNGRGELLRQLGEHRATVSDMVLHPFKPQLITGSYGEVLFWHTRDLVQESRLDYKGSVLRLAMSPNGKVLATGNQDSTVRFWRMQTGKDSEMWGYTRKVRELAWSRDSRFLATGGGASVTVWDFSGRGPENSEPIELSALFSPLTTLAFDPEGAFLAGGAQQGHVFIWHPGKRESVKALQMVAGAVTTLQWLPRRMGLLVGSDTGDLQRLDLAAV